MPHKDDPARHQYVEKMTESMMRALMSGQQGADQCAFCLFMRMAAKCMGTVIMIVDDTPETRVSLPAEMMGLALAYRDELLARQRAQNERLH
jgi:Fe2+ transport system protein B